MISGLRLQDSACFEPEGTLVGPFRESTFIFGANGSGKSTIARALQDPARYGRSEILWESPAWTVRTYNRDFVDRAFGPSGLPGVFLLGEESKADHDALEVVAKSLKERVARRGQLQENLDKKIGELDAERSKLETAAWAGEAKIPAPLADLMLTGFRGSRRVRREQVERVIVLEGEAKSFDDLRQTATTVLNSSSVLVGQLPLVASLFEGFDYLAALIKIPLVGSGDVDIAPLIERLGHSDWVRAGREPLNYAAGLCPFCQQPVPDSLLTQLEALFDGRYAEQIKRLEAIEKNCTDYIRQVEPELELLLASSGLWLEEAAGEAIRKLTTDIRTTRRLIREKIDRPSGTAGLPDLRGSVDAVNELLPPANEKIDSHNRLVQNRVAERDKLKDDCWFSYVHVSLAEEIGAFKNARERLDKAVTGLTHALSTTDDAIADLENQRDELHARTRSSAHTIEKVNAMLDQVGFLSFRLAQSPELEDGYRLERSAAQEADHATLSEGERTFITFLFYYHQLRDTQLAQGETYELVAVIDDPISSLDSDILFVIGSLIKSLLRDLDSGTGRVRQLLLLTHNAHFHNEIAYGREGNQNQFLRIRKRRDAANFIEDFGGRSSIKTAYKSLWEEIWLAQENPGSAPAGLPNTMRRILESYFRILGGIRNDELFSSFAGDEQLICRSLFSWANDGSHLSILDSLDHSPSDTTMEMYLQVFHDVFVQQGQERHYDMMMNAARTYEPALIN